MGDTSASQLGDTAYKRLFLLAVTNDSLGAGDMLVMPPQLLAAAVQLALRDDSLNRQSADKKGYTERKSRPFVPDEL